MLRCTTVSHFADVTGKRSKEASKYWEAVDRNRQDFTSWTQLIAIVDKESNVENVREVYDEFLLYYPYCYGYWKKLADFIADKVDVDAAQKVNTVTHVEKRCLTCGDVDVLMQFCYYYSCLVGVCRPSSAPAATLSLLLSFTHIL